MGVAIDLGIDYSTVLSYLVNIHKVEIENTWTSSVAEREVASYIEELGFQIERNKRKLTGFELDIYIPSKKFAIEFNGIYWHSQKDEKYHRTKFERCENIGINLFQITCQDWKEKQDLVKSMISSRLGVSKKIYARKCKVGEVSAKEYRKFCEQNHISGYSHASIIKGLFFEGELVQIMSFLKSRYDKNYDWEIIRACSKMGYTIIGGTSKLFSRRPQGSIISYCDLQYGTGNSYKKIGMMKIRRTSNGYKWAKKDKLYSRIKFQKHKLESLFKSGELKFYDPTMTESENMFRNGYSRYWDSGHDVYVMKDSC